MSGRTFAMLATVSVLAAIAQLAAARWGMPGEVAGSVLSGVILLGGWRALAPEMEEVRWLPLFAIVASGLGLLLAVAGAAVGFTRGLWAVPLCAAIPAGIPAVWVRMRGARCHLCRRPLRRLLSFACPRCALVACEHCWEFERGRCHLCAANQVALFPVESAWWQRQFGPQVHEGRCALCLRTADWQIAHWACPSCGHTQCRQCWDDNNGQCSRCAWSIPHGSEHAADGDAGGVGDLPHEQELSHAQVPDAVRHGSR